MTIAELHAKLGDMIAQGHGDKPVLVYDEAHDSHYAPTPQLSPASEWQPAPPPEYKGASHALIF